ncbi:MAG: DUF222 domain-containing protein [Lautropia sp.]
MVSVRRLLRIDRHRFSSRSPLSCEGISTRILDINTVYRYLCEYTIEGIMTEPIPLAIAELEAQITELAGHLNAANYRWLMLIAEFDRREGWADGTTPSCAHWLSWKCGIDRGAAREKVRVARALEGLPQLSAAMARGALSYSKVRALTRVASRETEATLLMIALHGTAQHVETLVRYHRRAQESMELDREARQVASRSLHYHYDDDGSLVLQARLPAEAGALLLKALERATDDFHREGRASISAETSPMGNSLPEPSDPPDSLDSLLPPSPPPPTLSQRRADALARFAETWLAHGDQALSGGERQQIVVHVDLDTLRETAAGLPGQPGRCEIEDGPALAAQTARRLACDASVVRLVEDGFGRALDVGRKTRSIAPAIRRALQARDRGCRFPGCTHTRFLDGHHIRHWADGGATRLSNLVLLCRFHHRQVHEGRIDVLVLDDGALRFSAPGGGRPFESALPSTGDGRQIVLQHRQDGLAIEAGTAVTRWCGERMDYGIAVEGLLREQQRGQAADQWRPADVSAEACRAKTPCSSA